MKIDGIGIIGLASRKIDYVGQAQTTVAQNIANADTPGYTARRAVSFAEHLRTARMEMDGTAGATPVEMRPVADTWGTSLNGNTVSLTQETLAANSLSGDHKLATTLMKKSHQMIALAATKP